MHADQQAGLHVQCRCSPLSETQYSAWMQSQVWPHAAGRAGVCLTVQVADKALQGQV